MGGRSSWTVPLASLFLAVCQTALALVGNWLSGEGSPRATLQSVTGVVLLAWVVVAAAIVAVGWVADAAHERDNPLPPRERLAPRFTRQLLVGFVLASLMAIQLMRRYFGGTLDIESATLTVAIWSIGIVVAVVGARLLWRRTGTGSSASTRR